MNLLGDELQNTHAKKQETLKPRSKMHQILVILVILVVLGKLVEITKICQVCTIKKNRTRPLSKQIFLFLDLIRLSSTI